jgi:hypothetical protein
MTETTRASMRTTEAMSLYGILRKKVVVGTGLNIYINQGGSTCEPMLACRPQAVYPAAWSPAALQVIVVTYSARQALRFLEIIVKMLKLSGPLS